MALMELICTDANGLRRVNELEEMALRHTFGEEVGNWLIGIIKLNYDPSVVKDSQSGLVPHEVNGEINLTQINMASDYIPENLWWLGSFIHEATHIWQKNTCRHVEGIYARYKEYRYDVEQFPDLEVEQHAKAVEHWFFASYGIESNLMSMKYQVSHGWGLWEHIVKAYRNSEDDKTNVMRSVDNLRKLIRAWDPLIEEIRDPTHIPDIPGTICEELKDPPAG